MGHATGAINIESFSNSNVQITYQHKVLMGWDGMGWDTIFVLLELFCNMFILVCRRH